MFFDFFLDHRADNRHDVSSCSWPNGCADALRSVAPSYGAFECGTLGNRVLERGARMIRSESP